MYQAYYHLSADPFRLTPDPRFCFPHQAYAKAWAYMRYALEVGEGFIVVTGQPGTGKTTLTAALIEDLKHSKILSARLVGTHLGATDLLRNMAYSFDIDSDTSDRATLVHRIEQFLSEQSRSNRRVLLILDEAQGISDTALEELRLLADLQVSGRPLIQMFLLGQDQLHRVLDTPELEQFQQRVVAACHLHTLNPTETRDFIEHRLRCAGWQGDPQFSGRAILSIYRHSHGLPRHINKMCGRLILRGYTEEKHVLGEKDVLAIVSELDDEKLTPLESEQELDSDESVATGREDASAWLDRLSIRVPKARRLPAAPASNPGASPAAHVDSKERNVEGVATAYPPRYRRRRYRWGHKSKARIIPRLAPLLLGALRSAAEHAKSAANAWNLETRVARLKGVMLENARRIRLLERQRDRLRSAVQRGLALFTTLGAAVRTRAQQFRPRSATAAAVGALFVAALVFATVGVKNLRTPQSPNTLLAESGGTSTEDHGPEDAAAEPGGNTGATSTMEADEIGVRPAPASEAGSADSARPGADSSVDRSLVLAEPGSTPADGKDDESEQGTEKKYPDIFGEVLLDMDGDPFYDEKEDRGIAGVTVELRDENGNVIAVTVSDSEGYYRFNNVRDGNYWVVITDVNDVLFGYSLISGSYETSVTINAATDEFVQTAQSVSDLTVAPSYGTISTSKEPTDWFADGGILAATGAAHRLDTETEAPWDPEPPFEDCLDASGCGGSPDAFTASDAATPTNDVDTGVGVQWETSIFPASPVKLDNHERWHYPALMHSATAESGPRATTETRIPAQTPGSPEPSPASPGFAELERYPPLTILAPADQNGAGGAEEAPGLREAPQDPVPGLLSAATLAYEENRLSIPGNDSALHYYKKVLSIEPDNAAAIAGIGRLAERYTELAENALARALSEKARRFVARGLRVDPEHRELLALRERITLAMAEEAEMREAALTIEADLPPSVSAAREQRGVLQRLKAYFNDNSRSTLVYDSE